MPILYVIAGPNGAGKSSLSTTILPEGLGSFDGDKELQILQQKFTATDDAQLFSYVNDSLFAKCKEEAIKDYRDFAFETNFATAEVMDSVKQFQERGYEVNLIYIGLPSVEQAMARVDMRVQQGGHIVSREDIRNNYKSGIEYTQKFLHAFDQVLLLDNAAKVKVSLPLQVAKFRKGKLISKSKEIPDWAKKMIKERTELLPKKRRSGSKGKRI